MFCLEACNALAIAFRIFVSGITCVCPELTYCAAMEGMAAGLKSMTSDLTILPCGPLPVTPARSIFFSCAILRASGETRMRTGPLVGGSMTAVVEDEGAASGGADLESPI